MNLWSHQYCAQMALERTHKLKSGHKTRAMSANFRTVRGVRWRQILLPLAVVALCACQAEVTTQIVIHPDATSSMLVRVHLDKAASDATRKTISDAVSAIASNAGVAQSAVEVKDDGDTIDFKVQPSASLNSQAIGVGTISVTRSGKNFESHIQLVNPGALKAALDSAAAKEADPLAVRKTMGASVSLTVVISMPGEVTTIGGVQGVALKGENGAFTATLDEWPEGELVVIGLAQRAQVWWKQPLPLAGFGILVVVFAAISDRRRRDRNAIGIR